MMASNSPSLLQIPPEVLALIGEQIHCQRTLRALITCCRAFRDVFSPALYANRILHLNHWRPEELAKKTLPPGIALTKDFEVHLMEFRERKIKYKARMNKEYISFVISCLKATRNLQSFKWTDGSFEMTYHTCLMLRDPEFLRALKSCSTLKNITIHLDGPWLEDSRAAKRCWMPLKGFQNLTSLEIYNFFGNEDHAIQEITAVLADCPGLKTLGLGLLTDRDCDEVPEAVILNRDRDFLEKLCSRFGALGKAPLRLHTLRLGIGMCFDKPHLEPDQDYLEKLVVLQGLRRLHVFNDLAKYDLDDFGKPMTFACERLSKCTKIQQLSISILETGAIIWLANYGKSVEELIVTHCYGVYDLGLDAFTQLRLPNLRALYTRERSIRYDGQREFDDESSDSSGITDDEFESTDSGFVGEDPEIARCRRAAKAMTALDRLHDGGKKLEVLGLSLDFETQWDQFKSHLPTLVNLRQLGLSSKLMRRGQYPSLRASLWPGYRSTTQVAYGYARLIQSLCPSLTHIRIGYLAWEVINCPSAPGLERKVWLRKMEHQEFMSLEILGIDLLGEQSGLPAQGTPYIESTKVGLVPGQKMAKIYVAGLDRNRDEWREQSDSEEEDC